MMKQHLAEAKRVRKLASELTDWVNAEPNGPDLTIGQKVISATTYLYRYAFLLEKTEE